MQHVKGHLVLTLSFAHTHTHTNTHWFDNRLPRGDEYAKLETVSIAEPLQNRQHARETPNAVNTRRERE